LRDDISPIEQVGEIIFDKILSRDPHVGGHGTEVLGAQGSGKTSFLLHLADIFTKRYPDEILFWRESVETPVQFTRFPKWRIFVERGLHFRILDKLDGGREIDIPYETFDTLPVVSYNRQKLRDPEFFRKNQENKEIQDDIFSTICSRARGGELTVLYFKEEFSWVDLMRFLRTRPKFQTLLLDEMEEIFPAATKEELWHRIEWAKDNFKHIRKGLVNLIGNTQDTTDIDWRIRRKLQIHIYLPGAVPDRRSRVIKKAMSVLKPGEAYMDWCWTLFGKINFPAYRVTDSLWEVRL